MQGEDHTKQVKNFEEMLSPEQREAFLNSKKIIFDKAFQCTWSLSQETIQYTDNLMKRVGGAMGEVLVEALSSNCQPR
jgi:hypothetical protein